MLVRPSETEDGDDKYARMRHNTIPLHKISSGPENIEDSIVRV